ncbi:MAG: hypothetical protein QGG40_21975, partial [Myxococcota bacterium]|nr:hypothetical protein [Myxococcota bacterium]
AAAESLDAAQQIATLIDEYAPELLEGEVPPDPDLFPYQIDLDGYIQTYWDESEGGMQWSDTYEVGISGEGQDLYNYLGFAVDMEDVDILDDDNMGDYLDQSDDPLVLWWPLFFDGAYCSSVYFNPTDYGQESDVAYVPSSVLYMRVDVW